MKPLAKIFFAVALGGAAVSYAGPGPQFWNHPTTRPAVKPAPRPADSELKCGTMLIPTNNSKQAPYRVVKCTPDMMAKNDWRCQMACAQAMKKG